MSQPALDHWALWLGVNRATLGAAAEMLDSDEMASAYRLSVIPPGEQAIRRLTMVALRRLSPDGRWAVTSGLKRLRRIAGHRALDPSPWASAALFRLLARTLDAPGFSWRGKRAAVCLTHDIDGSRDWAALDDLVTLERRAGVRSTINLLSRGGYRIDGPRVCAWAEEGFEIGLHGDDHDLALGFRPPHEIRRRLEEARAAIPASIRGFRAPALSGSERLLAVLEELEFQYDSSWAVGSAGGCFPFRAAGRAVWEIPLTLQDSMLFRDERLADDAAFDVTRDRLARVIEVHGVFVLNTHPSLLRRASRYYAAVLDELRRRDADVAVMTMQDAATLVGG